MQPRSCSRPRATPGSSKGQELDRFLCDAFCAASSSRLRSAYRSFVENQLPIEDRGLLRLSQAHRGVGPGVLVIRAVGTGTQRRPRGDRADAACGLIALGTILGAAIVDIGLILIQAIQRLRQKNASPFAPAEDLETGEQFPSSSCGSCFWGAGAGGWWAVRCCISRCFSWSWRCC